MKTIFDELILSQANLITGGDRFISHDIIDITMNGLSSDCREIVSMSTSTLILSLICNAYPIMVVMCQIY